MAVVALDWNERESVLWSKDTKALSQNGILNSRGQEGGSGGHTCQHFGGGGMEHNDGS